MLAHLKILDNWLHFSQGGGGGLRGSPEQQGGGSHQEEGEVGGCPPPGPVGEIYVFKYLSMFRSNLTDLYFQELGQVPTCPAEFER